jgi:hypothetical protein
MSKTTRERRGKPVTHGQARASAQRLINSHFHNDNRARMSIPVDYDDDDCTIHDYISEQESRDKEGD